VQPEENSNGRTNGNLITYATAAGIPTDASTTFGSCVTGEEHKALVAAMTDKASQKGVNSTPTVYVNGKKLADHSLATLQAAIAAADAKGPAPSPSPTTSPSGTGSATASGTASTSPSGTATP